MPISALALLLLLIDGGTVAIAVAGAPAKRGRTGGSRLVPSAVAPVQEMLDQGPNRWVMLRSHTTARRMKGNLFVRGLTNGGFGVDGVPEAVALLSGSVEEQERWAVFNKSLTDALRHPLGFAEPMAIVGKVRGVKVNKKGELHPTNDVAVRGIGTLPPKRRLLDRTIAIGTFFENRHQAKSWGAFWALSYLGLCRALEGYGVEAAVGSRGWTFQRELSPVLGGVPPLNRRHYWNTNGFFAAEIEERVFSILGAFEE